MQLWALLEFAFALTTLIGGIALIIEKLHVIERAEEQELWTHIKVMIANMC